MEVRRYLGGATPLPSGASRHAGAKRGGHALSGGSDSLGWASDVVRTSSKLVQVVQTSSNEFNLLQLVSRDPQDMPGGC
eukprot:4992773-Prorocentrum_lima.AAC.1